MKRSKILYSFWNLLLLSFLCFFFLHHLPGGPFDEEAPFHPLVQEALRQHYGLDRSFLEQFWMYWKGIFSGTLGYSMIQPDLSVMDKITQVVPATFRLGVISSLLVALFGYIGGVLLFRVRTFRGTTDLVMYCILSLPTLVLAPWLMYFFSVRWNLLPILMDEKKLLSFILPVFVLILRPSLRLSRILASSLDKSMSEPYILTAKAMGIPSFRIINVLAMKNAIFPFVTILPSLIIHLLNGSILVEVIFASPGLGTAFVDSILNRDYTMTMGLALFYGIILSVVYGVFDFILELLDPQVREALY